MDNYAAGKETKNMKIGIVGLGLIGGSIAYALREKAGVFNIVAVDTDAKSLKSAMDIGLLKAFGIIGGESKAEAEAESEAEVEAEAEPETEAEVESEAKSKREPESEAEAYACLKGCKVVFICTSVSEIKRSVENALKYCTGIITDTGSIKNEIMKDIEYPRFIGGHPMTGSERSGFAAANSRLFENAIYVLCKKENTDPADVKLLKKIVMDIGALPVSMDAAEHDAVVGYVSHLPHIAAACLSNTVDAADKGKLKSLAAGGFRDITRIASSNPKMWADIIMQNKKIMLDIMELYIKRCINFKDALSGNNIRDIEEFFKCARDYRESIPFAERGVIPYEPEIWVDVADKPGVLGQVTTILGQNGINIRNIHIQNSREYEGGCLRISLSGEKAGNKSVDILSKAGYKCRLIN